MATLIDIPGTFDNLEDGQGHNLITTLCEVIDNANDAKAKNVKIWISKDTITISDNGSGMDSKKLEESHILNKRSDPSSKIGRFGAGLKAFILKFLEKSCDKTSTTISSNGASSPEYVRFTKSKDGTGPYLWPAAELGDTAKALWNKYKLAETGTVIHVPISNETFGKISECILADTVFENLQFQIGQIYHAVDIDIKINMANVDFIIPKISPISDPSRVFVQNISEDIKITSCWVEDASIQDAILRSIRIKPYRVFANGNQNQKKTKDLGGKFIARGGRVISRQDINKPGSGWREDQERHVHTRHVIDFKPSIENDAKFGVSVNKSSLDQTKMDNEIKQKISGHIKLADKYFKELASNIQSASQTPDTQSEYESDSESEPPVTFDITHVDDSSTESDAESESEILVDPIPPPVPVNTFKIEIGEKRVIVEYGGDLLYNVPCPKNDRKSFRDILIKVSKSKSMEVFKQYVEKIIEANQLIID
jgi:hypothetical protein